MGIFGTIGKALGGAVKGGIGGFLKGGPIGALTGGASGALGGLLGGGGLGGAIKGGLLGAVGGQLGQQSGLSPAAIAALSGIASAQLAERGKQRESAEAQFNARQDLLTRNLGLAERSFADKAPLRNFGLGSLRRFAEGGFGRGIFQTPAERGQAAGSLEGAPISKGGPSVDIFEGSIPGSSLFGPKGGAFEPSDVKPGPAKIDIQPTKRRSRKSTPVASPKGREKVKQTRVKGITNQREAFRKAIEKIKSQPSVEEQPGSAGQSRRNSDEKLRLF